MMDNSDAETPVLSRSMIYIMAVGCGVSVANNYYSQPLLRDMAATFRIPEAWAGYVPALAQAGFALGMLVFVPLGDMLERRSLITSMLLTAVGALIVVAISPNFPLLAIASLLLGFFGIVPQLLIPLAAHLAPILERGRVVGTVMSGLLIGVLISRTVSGFVGHYLGWRAMYWIAALVTLGLLLALRASLPTSKPTSRLSYWQLLASLPTIFREEPVLRQSCMFGAASFGAFSAFWTTLVFFLSEPPYGYGSEVVGLFGLIGVVGAIAAPLVGRYGDRNNPRTTVGFGLAIILASFVLFWVARNSLWGLIVGVVFMDLGAQATHISNQTRVHGLRPDARNRLTTLYMVGGFVGGGLGSSLGAFAWSRWQWAGVCDVGVLLPLAALIVFVRTALPAAEVSEAGQLALEQSGDAHS